MHNSCYTLYITGITEYFTASSESRAEEKARNWLLNQGKKLEDFNYWVEDTTDKFMDAEENEVEDDQY